MVAILNIQIPQVMGDLINIISRYTNGGVFLKEMKIPVLKLIFMYIAQVRSFCKF